MSQNPQTEGEVEDSIVQPGFPLNPCLPQALEGDLIAGEKAYQGIYSDVFKGTWKHNETVKAVCIKVLRQVHIDLGGDDMGKEAKERFRRMRGEDAYLVSPWADNGSLDAYLVRNPELPVAERLQISLQVSRGLAYLHSFEPPIVHGDLKPGNILLRKNLPAALCDFGLSRVMVTIGHSGLTTGPGTVGTSCYLAKEIIDGSGPTTKSDVYSMAGIILAVGGIDAFCSREVSIDKMWFVLLISQAMSGNGPFHKKPTAAIANIAVYLGEKCQPADHPKFPGTDPMWSFLDKCWNSTAEARPSAHEVVEELERSVGSHQSPAPPYEAVEGGSDSKSKTASKPEAS
ncbi:hypothetical protein FS837_000233 [Tulasnella sp. UAMH 9824]|nr:hypothetical protein FS837_000233 [Tulasnella sp. UAMH 9824]